MKALGVLIKPPSTGLLFRTEAEKIKEELLIEDLEHLIQQWENILKVSEASHPPNLVKRDDDFSLKILIEKSSSLLTKFGGLEASETFSIFSHC